MRSSAPTRRLRSRPPRHARLETIARLVDDGVANDDSTQLLFYVEGIDRPDDEEMELGIRPLPEGSHPFGELAGFTAPPSWSAFGLRTVGTASYLDEPDRPPQRVSSTVMIDRRGRSVSLLRSGGTLDVIDTIGDGVVPDTCRRVLGLPTAAPPRSSAVLWTLAWLDGILDAWGDLPSRRALSTWAGVARLHPALERVRSLDGLHDPGVLLVLAADHAAQWSWERLRQEPHRLKVPGGSLPVDITMWMDDGFFARWMIGAYPSLSVLATDVPQLLGDPLREQLVTTALRLLD